jgi:hypothetical protein
MCSKTCLCPGRRNCGDIKGRSVSAAISRICDDCGKEKTIRNWYDGACRPCYMARTPKRQALQKHWQNQYSSTTKGRFNRAVQAAKIRGLSWTLDFTTYSGLVQWPCGYCGDALCDTGVALDRMDNDRGYEPGNVVPCCSGCNDAKSDKFNYQEFKKHVSTTQRMRGTQFIWRGRPNWRKTGSQI